MATTWPQSWPPAVAELHIFDPEGDVLFILTRSDDEESIKNYGEKKKPIIINIENDDGDADHVETDLSEDCATQPTMTSKIISETDVHMRASSKVLSLVSCVFNKMFGPDFKEGATLKSQGSVTIHLPDDDPDCLIILLNIIHGMTRKVPRGLENPDTLVGLATLIDYYQLHEVAELFSDGWLSARGGEDAREHVGYGCHHLLQDLWISWVFQDSSAFKDVMRSLILTGKEGFDDFKNPEMMQESIDRLPIPLAILELIKTRRDIAIKFCISKFYQLLRKYNGPETCCESPFMDARSRMSCDAMVLGFLIKGAQQARIGPAPKKPKKPYKFSFESLASALRRIEVRSLCTENSTGSPGTQDAHEVEAIIRGSVNAKDLAIRGYDLEISKFLPRGRKRMRE
ncbi:hypothetical protein VTL71DRAFT_12945 [Oculimacula yallundae]|uniref:BTB domain-containing protein n=1 Tax=Oculimacula yallundae TaxID=86028 RepID=A0ABR4CPE8_9HELO